LPAVKNFRAEGKKNIAGGELPQPLFVDGNLGYVNQGMEFQMNTLDI
jgi:hypothetical protein